MISNLQEIPRTPTHRLLPRLRLWIRRRELIVFLLLVILPPTLAWVYYLGFGLPPTQGDADPASADGPHPYPAWVRGSHYLNLLLSVLLVRGGWRILMDHPQLYWTEPAEIGTEWARLGLNKVSSTSDLSMEEVSATSSDDSKSYRHSLMAVIWVLVGLIYVVLVFATGQWERAFPRSWSVFSEALRVFVQYATFHLPLRPDGYWRYNSLQLLSYSVVVFLFCPGLILSGLAISPAITGFVPWLPRLFGNRQAARSIHVLLTVGYLAFVGVHLFFVVLYGFWLNLNHIVLGTDETGLPGGVIAAVGIGTIALIYAATNRVAWRLGRPV